jgi:peptidoglycan/xylan/chitin deacetylase (PgdA/CDA1 family)
MTEITFTFDWYKKLLQRLLEEEYRFGSFGEAVTPKTALLRHDVDWSPRKAVRIAEIEADLGITSTYFFLVSSPFYNVMNAQERAQIAQIKEFGHEIGLHFSTHQYFDSESNGEDGYSPTDEEIIAPINQERKVLESAADQSITAVSFHNPPEWTFRRSFSEFASTYEPRFFEEIVYRADSNQRWRDEPPFAETIPSKVQILTHPVLWDIHDGYATDRLREERDYNTKRLNQYIKQTDRTWNGYYGLNDRK